MSICSLLEVYRENTDGCRTIVLKHLPDDADENDLHNYLERVCKSDVKDVRVPAAGCGVAIVTFTDIVFDTKVQRWQKRAFSKDYQGCYPTLELLVNPTGLFVTGVPDKVTDELLLLYFESSKSGGIEDTVDKAVELVTIGSSRHAIIPLTSEQAIASILSQQSHKLHETVIAVGPFYPNVHRPILETLKSRELVKEAVAPFNSDDTIIERDVIQGSGQINFGASSAMTVEPDVAFVDNIGDSDQEVQQGTDDSYVRKRIAAMPFPRSNRDQTDSPARSGQNVATVKPFLRYERDTSEARCFKACLEDKLRQENILIEEKLDTSSEGLWHDSNSDSEQETLKGGVFENSFELPDILLEESQSPEAERWQMSKSRQDNSHEPKIAKSNITTRTITIGNKTVKLIQGAVVKQRADALVNVVSATRGLSEGVVSKSFVDMGGESLSQMYEAAKSSTSDFVTTGSSGKLKCSIVVHVHLQRSEHCQKIVRRAVSNVLETCNTLGCKTVAFPPLGVGKMFGFPPGVVAETMLAEIYRQLESKKHNIRQAALVIYNRDVYELFDSAFEAFNPRATSFRKGVDPQKCQASSEAKSLSEVRQRPPSGARRHAVHPAGREKNRQLSTRGRSNNAAQRSRGTHSSSSSSSYSRDSGDRKIATSNNTNQTEKNSLDVQRKRKANTKRETKEFVEVEPEVPSYWKNYKQGETLKSVLMSAKHFLTRKKFEIVEVNKDTYTFSSVVKMVNATFNPSLVGQGQDAVGLDSLGYDKLFVLKVERVENLHLYEQFTGKRQTLLWRLHASGEVRFPKLDDIPKCSGGVSTSRHVHGVLGQDLHPEINEHLLFHGTKDSNVNVICNDGFEFRLGSEKAMLGPGIYAAESATKADQYADEKSNRSAGKGNHKKMFLIRMMLGNSFLCTDPNPRKYRRPPCTQCYKDDCRNVSHGRGRFGKAFDSVVGDNKKLFREFVVYENSLCYPEYLITYERR